jgi:hypothetical protein
MDQEPTRRPPADESQDDGADADEPTEPSPTSAARAKEKAAEQSVDPATWRTGGVGIDP